MPEELQGLLERIQKDGVDKAEAQAKTVVEEAGARAAAMVQDAETQAAERLQRAESDAAAFEERARKSLEQAARDLVLTVRGALGAALDALVSREVAEALDADALRNILPVVIESYVKQGGAESRIDVLLSPAQQKEVTDALLADFAAETRKGVEIKGDETLGAGFRISLVGDKVEHDFSDKAIAQALSHLLRPRLAEIVKTATEA